MDLLRFVFKWTKLIIFTPVGLKLRISLINNLLDPLHFVLKNVHLEILVSVQYVSCRILGTYRIHLIIMNGILFF